MKHFNNHETIRVVLVVTNRKDAGVIKRAQRFGVEVKYLPKSTFIDSDAVLSELEDSEVDWIVLAGWLLLIPEYLVKKYNGHIINIHPALLPKYGGKGMFGRYVHQAVKEAKEAESGITIHLVNERFDEGEILAQHKCQLLPSDTSETIEEKVRFLELKHYASEIEQIVLAN